VVKTCYERYISLAAITSQKFKLDRLSHKEATIKVCSLVDTYFTLKDVRYKNVSKSKLSRTLMGNKKKLSP
jgi:hypothetical protein